MSLTQRLNYRCLLLCTLPRLPLGPSDFGPSRPCGPFPHPRVLTPTCSTAGLASQTEPPLQSAPLELYLVRVFTTKTDWAPVVLLGSHLGIRSDKPVSCCPPIPFLEILFLLACVDEWRT